MEATPIQSAIVGRSATVRALHDRVETLAKSEAPVLISGESGTGKELVARMLHDKSPRAQMPFVAVNCAAFPETLLEAELFGYERGAFTGALRKREGRFKAAQGGTLLLDEVGEIPLSAQAKLLRVLQEGTYEPLGTNASVRTDVRIISATHQNLKERISQNLFREDLYFRLNVLDVHIVPLRSRREDIPVLVQHFLALYSHGQPPRVSNRFLSRLLEYPFPGNVRELAHAIEHAVVLAGNSEIDLLHLPSDLATTVSPDEVTDASSHVFSPLQVAQKQFEREYLLRALEMSNGCRTKAAELLGISRKNLWEKLKGHRIGGVEPETEIMMIPSRVSSETPATRADEPLGEATPRPTVVPR